VSRTSPGRSAQFAREKADHPTARTSGELRDLLRISESTFKRAREDGRIPEPAYHSISGWPLWSADQVTALLRRRIEKGRL
jgi:hypothetical protein